MDHFYFVVDIFEVLIKNGIIPENNIMLRNLKIKHEYQELCKSGVASKDARRQLSEKYFLGEKSIERIIYKK